MVEDYGANGILMGYQMVGGGSGWSIWDVGLVDCQRVALTKPYRNVAAEVQFSSDLAYDGNSHPFSAVYKITHNSDIRNSNNNNNNTDCKDYSNLGFVYTFIYTFACRQAPEHLNQ